MKNSTFRHISKKKSSKFLHYFRDKGFAYIARENKVSKSHRAFKRLIYLGTTVVGGSRPGRGILLRTLVFVFLATFLWLQLHVISLTGRDYSGQSSTNETLYSLVPQELHR